MAEEPPRCLICDHVPHNAKKLACSNALCRTYVCGTNVERRCCVAEFSRNLSFPYWNRDLGRLEFGACRRIGCHGILLGIVFRDAEQHELDAWNSSQRDCDWHVFGNPDDGSGTFYRRCSFRGNHAQLEAHVLQHERPTFNPNRFIPQDGEMESDQSEENLQVWNDDDDDDDVQGPLVLLATDDEEDDEE